MEKKEIMICVLEWSDDHGFVDLDKVNSLTKGDWRLPTLEEFNCAIHTDVDGFEQNERYWVPEGRGDMFDIIPASGKTSLCNSHSAMRRLRLVRVLNRFSCAMRSNDFKRK